MDPEEKVLLEKLVELNEENNEILHKMRRATHWGMVWSFVKFLIIVVPIILVLSHYRPQIENTKNDLSEISQILLK
jgi:hypothetical protein